MTNSHESKILYPNKKKYYDKTNWNNLSNGLIVIIHGLLGNPITLGYEISKKNITL